MIDPKLSRWIKASVSKYFTVAASGTFIYIENQDRKILQAKTSWVELSLDGPRVQESFSETTAEIDIDLLCNCKISNQLYSIENLSGKIVSLLTAIPIYKLGDADDEMVGCMELKPDSIRVTNWGQDSADITLTRSSVECSYSLYL